MIYNDENNHWQHTLKNIVQKQIFTIFTIFKVAKFVKLCEFKLILIFFWIFLSIFFTSRQDLTQLETSKKSSCLLNRRILTFLVPNDSSLSLLLDWQVWNPQLKPFRLN